MGNCIQAQKAIEQQKHQHAGARPLDLESTSSVENVDSILFEISPERKYISRCWNESDGEDDEDQEEEDSIEVNLESSPVFYQLSGKNQHVTLLPVDNTMPSTPGTSSASSFANSPFALSPPTIIKLRQSFTPGGEEGSGSEGTCSDTVHTDDSMDDDQEVEIVGVSKVLNITPTHKNKNKNDGNSNKRIFAVRRRRQTDDDEDSVVSELVEYFERLIEENTQPPNSTTTTTTVVQRKQPSSLLITFGGSHGDDDDDDLSLGDAGAEDAALSFSIATNKNKEPHTVPDDCKVDIRAAINALQEQGIQA